MPTSGPIACLSPLIYSVGALVEVEPEHRTDRPDSNGGKGWIHSFPPDGKATVKYIGTNRLSCDIAPRRLHQSSLATHAHRSERNRLTVPSLLSPEHRAERENRPHIPRTIRIPAAS
eukprot:scaffold306184_cov27-Attheya_sp.AAC.1